MKPSARFGCGCSLVMLIGLAVLATGCDPTQDLATNLAQFPMDLAVFFAAFARQLLAAALF